MYASRDTLTGTLFVVATPIGNLQDFSPRAQTVLSQVDLVLCEDTRTSAVLLGHYALKTKCSSLHAFNEVQSIDKWIHFLLSGQNVGLICDAGTPAISDAGQLLVAAAHQHGVRVSPIPGCCIIPVVVSCSGINAREFTFTGFLSAKRTQRVVQFEGLKSGGRPFIFLESRHRLYKCLEDLCKVFGCEHKICLCKEVTKIHETVFFQDIKTIMSWLDADELRGKGEFTVVVSAVDPESHPDKKLNFSARELFGLLCRQFPRSQAASVAARISGCRKKEIYDLDM